MPITNDRWPNKETRVGLLRAGEGRLFSAKEMAIEWGQVRSPECRTGIRARKLKHSRIASVHLG